MAKAHTLTDNFNDNTTNTAVWEAYYESKEVNQRLELRPAVGSTTGNYVGYQTKAYYDLTDSFIAIEAVQVMPFPGNETYIAANGNPGTPVVPSADGLALVAYTGSGATSLTVGGELNKLAGNIALFRNAAGVHWRSDYTESLPLGESVAIGLLQEMSLTFNEDSAFFQFTKFDGTKIRIAHGVVEPVNG